MSRYKIFQHYSLDTDIELTHRVISYGRLFFETYFKYIYIYRHVRKTLSTILFFINSRKT